VKRKIKEPPVTEDKVDEYRDRIYRHYLSGLGGASDLGEASLTSRAPTLRNIVRRHFPVELDAQILDLGCGHGAFVHFIREAGYRNVVGVDRSPEQVAEARKLGVEGVREGDLIETLRTLPDESQDVVITFDVIEHFTKMELIPFIDEVKRVLKPASRWIIHAPNGDSPFVGTIRYGDFTHEQAFTRTSLRQLLLASGFDRIECYEDKPHTQSIFGVARRILWGIFRVFLLLYLAAETGEFGRGRILSQNLLAVATKPSRKEPA
jgi:SAM-dependent methyltransferase